MALPKEDDGPPRADWITTYGDMMSLLLTFFVLLFSMSDIREEESRALLESLRRQFGMETTIMSPIAGPNPPMNSALAKLAAMGRAQRMNTMNGGDKVKAPVGEYARVKAIRPAEETTTGGVVHFPDDQAELSDESKLTLRQAVAVIGGKPQKLEIRGHTSARPLPPNSPYRNHWDLAYARCFNVMNYLVSQGIDPKRIRIGVAAENEPVHIGHDPEKQNFNSRVEVLMLDELTKDLEGTKEERRQKYSTQGAP